MRFHLPMSLVLPISALIVPTSTANAQNGSATGAARNGEATRLLRQPTLSAEQVAFMYANDIWVAPRAGGEAKRLTSFQGQETNPHFSPAS